MSDIVKVLRGKHALDYDEKTLDQFCNEAADEIEKLRTALRGVLAYYNAPTPAEAKLKKAVLATPIEQARAALGEKE
jgi:hypothetical protein